MSAATFQFKDKTALVTGAGRGIGRAVAKALSAAGAVTYALSKTQQHLDELVAECPNIHPVCVDLSDWDCTQSAIKSLPHIDLLVNNAGVGHTSPFLDVTADAFDKTIAVNLRAVFAVSQVVARSMVEAKRGGAIVNVSSQASNRALLNHSVYGSSKAAVDQLTRSMALELGPHQIRVNCVNPTVVMTDMARGYWGEPTQGNPMKARIPLGKFAEEEDVVSAILYLLTDSSAMINGVCIPIDGGFLAS